ncbi:hypothetical protein O287_02695 [Staphylococcus aureus M0094]|nr:hypothetical protein MQC_02582 [Staphylococcus aureus subsp. aureus VRS2]EIK19725.1 hypothetical protein MQM_02639 [Staphylococcus aureus subsp. aureus VRS7]EUI21231.1 hypothetical protein Q113_02692 [Staphylococcus aureus M1439]EUS74955.1 hypothetical protein O274_02716 [Staphylococcus aureus M0076]EUS77710.1 hypothetical protein O275_02707 [Staphylococcus aureus M0079]EUS89757.1 hypothetical protein O280_02688 [Staphylococcus aureus M0084]EUT08013.1 hypothetical protein O287_02695 [Staph
MLIFCFRLGGTVCPPALHLQTYDGETLLRELGL